VRDAIAMAVDKQKENADKRGRKNMETFKVGERVLLSVTGITAHAVTNLGANKLLPRFIGAFTIVAALGDAYTIDIPTAMRLHPTFYVGRLKRYHPATIPGEESQRPTATEQEPSLPARLAYPASTSAHSATPFALSSAPAALDPSPTALRISTN
jgi:hypothetical protein